MKTFPLDKTQLSSDLATQEAEGILNAGLALMPVQQVPHQGWIPDVNQGKFYGKNAANHAVNIGFPTGVNVWCDLEGISESADIQNVIDYC